MNFIHKTILLALTPLLAACSYGNNTPGATAAGGILGGLAGMTLFHGSTQPYAVIGSAVVGGLVGNSIGKKMDEQETRTVIFMSSPIREEPLTCKHVTTTVYRGGQPAAYYVRMACLMEDGRWHCVEN